MNLCPTSIDKSVASVRDRYTRLVQVSGEMVRLVAKEQSSHKSIIDEDDGDGSDVDNLMIVKLS